MNTKQLQGTMFFREMSEEEISSALAVLQAEEREYVKGRILFSAGSTTDRMGLVLEGSVTIESNDVWGNRTILSHVGKGQFFAETYAFLTDEPLLVDVVANEQCRALFFRTGIIRNLTNVSEAWVFRLMTNLLTISAHKNLHLSGRSFHISPKTVRGRVMAYLNTVSLQKRSREFDIPFDRQQLADYLNLDRTALSKELGRMQKEGLIRTRKSHFVVC